MRNLQTKRLILREADEDDATFLVELMNDEGYLRLIGDRGVRTREDAVTYLRTAAIYAYGVKGLGFNVVEGPGHQRVGICGLVRRETLDDVDLGYAFLDRFSGSGYATEAATATLAHALGNLDLKRVVAITSVNNLGSRRVLEKIGMKMEKVYRPEGSKDDACLYAIERP